MRGATHNEMLVPVLSSHGRDVQPGKDIEK
jgi:hypothetical protein